MASFQQIGRALGGVLGGPVGALLGGVGAAGVQLALGDADELVAATGAAFPSPGEDDGQWLRRLAEEQATTLARLRSLLARALPHADQDELRRAIDDLVTLLRQLGDGAAALPLAERLVQLSAAQLGPTHRLSALAHNDLGLVQRVRGDQAAALAAFVTARGILEQTPDAAAQLAAVAENEALARIDSGDADGARRLLDAVVAARTDLFGPDDVRLIAPLYHLGRIALARRDGAAAAAYLSEGERISVSVHGEAHQETHNLRLVLADAYWRTGELHAMRELVERVRDQAVVAEGPDAPALGGVATRLALLAGAAEDPVAVRAHLLDAQRILSLHLPPDAPALVWVRAQLARFEL